MELFRKHFVSSLFGAFILGALTFWGSKLVFDHYHAKTITEPALAINKVPRFDDIFGQDFFKQSRDPFKEMERMHTEIMKNFIPFKQAEEDPFEHWFEQSFGGGAPGDFKMSEDDKFVYYEIRGGSSLPSEVEVKVNNGQVTIKTALKKSEQSSNNSSLYSSSFIRSFPAPENVDANNFKIERKENNLILKFPKNH